ncbi:MAG: toxin-antitoxin system YwqK family antitoxin [Sedimentisphaerales bacterium]|nr:toxin-antitoxin system YwqK family antitoxin [Sedimentisphaerales bacterium]
MMIRGNKVFRVSWWLLVLVVLVFIGALYAKTPAELDAVIERFKAEPNQVVRLDLSYQGLDLYAPIGRKSETIDRDDRDSLSEMKRTVIMNLMTGGGSSVLATAIGSGGTWLIDPAKVKNDYDQTQQDEIARLKHQGFYMEGLSDVDLAIMGAGARAFVNEAYRLLAEGRGSFHLMPNELDQLEMSLLLDEQISNLSSAGDSQRFWNQMLNVRASSPHPEKYITVGGKALYCVEHLWLRGAAIAPGPKPEVMKFSQWSGSAGHQIGPFTPQYLYGGCCDMDYFLRHALGKTEQEKNKTALQVIKYLERQAWMCKQAKDNAGSLAACGIEILPERIEHLEGKAQKVQAFCDGAIDTGVWKSDSLFAGFVKDALELSSDVCLTSHDLMIKLGRDLLISLDMNKLSSEQAAVLDDIAYDLETVHTKRYLNGRPDWYETHELTVKKETEEFLNAYRQRQAKTYSIMVKAGLRPKQDDELEVVEVGPIVPPTVVTVKIEDISIEPNKPGPGQTVQLKVKGRLEGLLQDDPNWSEGWLADEQKAAMKEVAIWSWLAAVRRIEIQHLMYLDGKNSQASKPSDFVYVSPYEISEIAEEELKPCEDEILRQSELLGKRVPEAKTGRVRPMLRAAPTLDAVQEYTKALDLTIEKGLRAVEAINAQCAAAINICQNVQDGPVWLQSAKKTLSEIKTDAESKIQTLGIVIEKAKTYRKHVEDLAKILQGDAGAAMGKATELEGYLEGLADQAQIAVYDSRALQNKLANGINLLRKSVPTVDAYRYPGLRDGLIKGIRDFDKEKNDIVLDKLPELEERAKWLDRGAWAAKSAKYALKAVSLVNEYQDARSKLSTTDLSWQTENAVVALGGCGEAMELAAGLIPIKALQEAVKQYTGILKAAPVWSAAFDKMMTKRYQAQGYDVRTVLLPEAYEFLINHDNDLEPGLYYRYNGPLAQYNDLIVFGHPVPEPKYLVGNKQDDTRAKVSISGDRMWLVWDKNKPNGFLRLSPDTFKRASLYAAWYRRVYNRPIKGPELHDLLTSGEILGGYLVKTPVVTVTKLKHQAENALRIESIGSYLATITGKASYQPDELRHYYGMLDQIVRRMADEGFIMDDEDVREILAKAALDPTIDASWATVLRYVPFGQSATELVNKGAEVWDSLAEGEKNRMSRALAERIADKKKKREEARKQFWGDAQKELPAGLKVDEVRLAVQHTLTMKNTEQTQDAFVEPKEPNFVFSWSTTVPQDTNADVSYICRVSIMGYENSAYERDLIFDVNRVKEPPPEPEKKPEPKETRPAGQCPIPQDAWLYEVATLKSYKLDSRYVGPYIAWYDKERTQVSAKRCYDENGQIHGLEQQWQRDGKLSKEGTWVHGKEEGAHTQYHKNGKPWITWVYSDGKLDGPYTRLDEEGKLDGDQGQYVNGLREGLWKAYWHGILRSDTNYQRGKREGLERYYRENGEISWQRIYENDREAKLLDKNGKVTKITTYIEEDGRTVIKEQYFE